MEYPMTTAYLIVFDLVLIGFFVEVLRRAGAGRLLRAGVAVCSLAWMVLLAFLLQTESLYSHDVSPAVFFVSILCCVTAFTIIGLLTPIRRILEKAPHALLMMPQGLRVFFGAGFLIQGILGVMPQSYAIVDGITHITAAFLCMKAAVLIQDRSATHGELWTAHLFGLADIGLVAFGLSFFLLHEVGPHHNVMLAALFAAPIFINLHLVSLKKLVAEGHPMPAEVSRRDQSVECMTNLSSPK